MKQSLLVGISLMALALAGCTSEPSELTIKYEAPDDPITGAFHFKASGPGDTYVWNFGDGTPAVEGASVEHTFGFTDGTIRVTLQGITGEETESVVEEIVLGNGQNSEPVANFQITNDWMTLGETFVMSGLGTTDADGDPLLFRFSCSFEGEPKPPHDDGHSDAGKGPVPFDVDAWAEVNPALSGGEQVSGEFCDAFSFDKNLDFSQTGAYTGSFSQAGAYKIDVEIRDPKMATSWKARAQVFVTDSRPSPTPSFSETGSLSAGVAGTQLESLCATEPSLCGNQISIPIKLAMPFSNGTSELTFSDGTSTGTYTIRQGTTTIGGGEAGSSGSVSDVAKATTLFVDITLSLGVSTDFTFTLNGNYAIDPYTVMAFP